MRRITANEDATLAQLIDNQSPPDPVLFREQFIAEGLIDATQQPDACIPIDTVKSLFSGQQVVMNQPQLLPVDGHEIPGALRIVEITHPGVRLRDAPNQLRCPDETGLHPLDDLVSAE